MRKRNFLIPLAVALAALTQTSKAALLGSPAPVKHDGKATNLNLSPEEVARATAPAAGESKDMMVPVGEDLFKFVLRRSEDGQLVAQHYSHYSHSSHSSHSSHHSHYSSRY